jgi:hypothetical protein
VLHPSHPARTRAKAACPTRARRRAPSPFSTILALRTLAPTSSVKRSITLSALVSCQVISEFGWSARVGSPHHGTCGSSSSAPASLVASPVPPSAGAVGILPGRRGQTALLIAGEGRGCLRTGGRRSLYVHCAGRVSLGLVDGCGGHAGSCRRRVRLATGHQRRRPVSSRRSSWPCASLCGWLIAST